MKQFILWIYEQCLQLYPPGFRAEFADEMRTIFALNVHDAARQGDLSLIETIAHELRDLPVSLLREHQRERRRCPAPVRVSRYSGLDGLRRLRRLTRVAAVIMGVLLLMPVLASLNQYQLILQTIPFALLLAIPGSGLLLACRWERFGAMLTLFGGVLTGAATVYAAYAGASRAGMNPIWIMLASSLWILPFMIFGVLFLQYSRREARLRTTLQ